MPTPGKKSPLVGELIRPSSHGEDGGEEWIKRSVSPHRFDVSNRRNGLRLSLGLRQMSGLVLVGLLLRSLDLFVHLLVPLVGQVVTREECHGL